MRDCQRQDHVREKHTPFPPGPNSDHFFTFSALCRDGDTPNTNGPTVSSLRVPRFTSRVCESKSDARFLWVAKGRIAEHLKAAICDEILRVVGRGRHSLFADTATLAIMTLEKVAEIPRPIS